jgi:hypothetical protein
MHLIPFLLSNSISSLIVILLHSFIISRVLKFDLHLIDSRNWSTIFIQSIEYFGIEFDQLSFWLDLWVRGLTNLKLLKFNQALKQSLVTMEKVFEVSIWSIMTQNVRFYFWIRNFSYSFLPNRSTISWVLHLIVFSSPCSFQWYIICGFS